VRIALAETELPEDVVAIARLAGLETVLAKYPDDVAAAVKAAMQAQDTLPAIPSVAEQPWPPVHMRRLR
jgi:hypothetical protein